MLHCFFISLSHSIRRSAARTRFQWFLSFLFTTHNRQNHNHACTLSLGGVDFCHCLSDLFHCLDLFTNLCKVHSVFPLEDYSQTDDAKLLHFTEVRFSSRVHIVNITINKLLLVCTSFRTASSENIPNRNRITIFLNSFLPSFYFSCCTLNFLPINMPFTYSLGAR